MKLDFGNMDIKEVAETLMTLYNLDDFLEVEHKTKIIVPDENTAGLLRARLIFEGLPGELMPKIEVAGTHILETVK